MMAEILIQLRVVVIGVAALLVTPILFVALDFWAGIRKAHQRGEKIRSDKMQRTLLQQYAALGLNYNATPSKINEPTGKSAKEADPLTEYLQGI